MRLCKFNKEIKIISNAAIVGELEKKGPLANEFDMAFSDTRFGQDTWEKAEAEMVRICIGTCLNKGKISPDSIEMAFGGDLINQCTSTSMGIKEYNIPFSGLYGACSTFALSLGLGAISIESGFSEKSLCVTSSHFCSAERQFRFPIEYGSQRTPTSQNTVTGSGCIVLGNSKLKAPKITEFLLGKICDFGISDANNMGAVMAPAAADTICGYFNESKLNPNDFDMILTGDLGFEGISILKELLMEKGIVDLKNLNDCGCMIYDSKNQDIHCGGSGCGCSASVVSSYIVNEMKRGNLKDILFIGTGALLNSASVLQKLSISGIAHLVRIKI